ncbi:MAG: hypothetical protein HQ547_05395 [Candidatus Omnitrophica bacterium]|nr:hypothetical protein [Candidatus Omnitrophota bacterium]
MIDTKIPVENDFKIEKTRFQTVVDAREPTKAKTTSKIGISKLAVYMLILSVMLSALVIYELQIRHNRDIKVLGEQITAISNSKAALQRSLQAAIRQQEEYKVLLEDQTERANALTVQAIQLLNSEIRNNKKIDALYSRLSGQKAENETLKSELKMVSLEKNGLQGQLTSFQRIQQNLQEKIKRLLTRTKVELGAVVVTPSAFQGNILRADREHNFAIIDLGKNDGIKKGMDLTAYRQERPIGAITIEKVYDELSVGRAGFEWQGDELKVGDTVKGKD